MNTTTPKINPKLLTPEQRDKLETYQQTKRQLQVLEDIADMTQELIQVFDKQGSTSEKRTDDMGSLLMDMRESLDAIKNKKDPEAPDTNDYTKPVVEAVTKLEKAIKAIEVKPVVNSPQVNVSPPVVDLKGVEQAVKAIPKAFTEAIKLIPAVEIPETDNTALLEAWEGISEQLLSIEAATRMKPQPGSMTVSNTVSVANANGTYVGNPLLTKPYDNIIITYTDSTKSVISTIVTKLNGAIQDTVTNTPTATVDDLVVS